MIAPPQTIAVIGAGMAGLTAGHLLARAGLAVTVFDKSRGVGGRLATRRSDVGPFNHGAPAVQGDADFDAAMTDLETATQTDRGWSGEPGMSGLLKPWLTHVTWQPKTRIVKLTQHAGWHLDSADGERYGPFQQLVITIPAPQVIDLWPDAAPDLAPVIMTPRWTLMAQAAATTTPRLDLFEAIHEHPDARWVAHATETWSRDHLEDDRDVATAHLAHAFQTALGRDDPLGWAVAHRWRFAKVVQPLGRPFWQGASTLYVGGDWALGDTAGHAYASGRAIARAILG